MFTSVVKANSFCGSKLCHKRKIRYSLLTNINQYKYLARIKDRYTCTFCRENLELGGGGYIMENIHVQVHESSFNTCIMFSHPVTLHVQLVLQ